jgi:hypothetical protein
MWSGILLFFVWRWRIFALFPLLAYAYNRLFLELYLYIPFVASALLSACSSTSTPLFDLSALAPSILQGLRLLPFFLLSCQRTVVCSNVGRG